MRRRLAALALVSCLLLLTAGGAQAMPAMDPEFLPPIPGAPPADAGASGAGAAAGQALMDRYPVWHYTVDGDASNQNDTGRQLGNRINAVLLYKAWALKATARLLHYPLRLRIGRLLADGLEGLTGGLTAYLWQGGGAELVTTALVLAGFFALWAGAFRSPAAGYRLLLRTVGLLLAALALTLNLSLLLRGLDEVTGDLSGAVFAAVTPAGAGSAAPAGQSTLERWGDAVWDPLVLQPWIQAEFGLPAAAAKYAEGDVPGGQFLALSPSQRQPKYYQTTYLDRQTDYLWWTPDFGLQRLVLAVVTAALALPVVLTGLVLTGGWLVYQLLAALLLAGAPLLLLAALWLPGRGEDLVRRWVVRLFSLVVLQVAFAFLLGGFVTLSIAAGLLSGAWPGQALLLAVVALAVLLTRREWLGLLGGLLVPSAAVPAGWLDRLGEALRGRSGLPAEGTGEAFAPGRQARPSLVALPLRSEAPRGMGAEDLPQVLPAAAIGEGEQEGSAREIFERELVVLRRTQVHSQVVQAIQQAAPAGKAERAAPAPGPRPSERALERIRGGRKE